MQLEYATDIVFFRKEYLQSMYDALTRTAIHTVKPEHIATFLGKKASRKLSRRKLGIVFDARTQGTRIKHTMGDSSLKMYDKFGAILKIETTANNVCSFERYREVAHRDGTREMKIAHVKKGIYNLSYQRYSAL